MKKIIFTLKIKFGSLLLSILQNRIGYLLFNILFFIFNLPFSIFFIIIWTYNVTTNYRYIKRHYSTTDLNELKEIGIEYIESFRKYNTHINIITWLLIIFLLNIL
jgi:hypothetical protein